MSVRLGSRAALMVSAASALTVSIDLVSKWVARRELRYGENHWLVDGVAGLELVSNRGVAFGLLESKWFTPAIVVVAVMVLVWLIFASDHRSTWTGLTGAGCMLGGALGNLVDRLPDGAVTDFIVLGPWPRFNLADTALTVGLGLLAMRQIREATTLPPLGET
jgi:signal peptidase II